MTMTTTTASLTHVNWNASATHSTPLTCQTTWMAMASVMRLIPTWTAMVCSMMWKLTRASTTTPLTLERILQTLTPMVMASVTGLKFLPTAVALLDPMRSRSTPLQRSTLMATACRTDSTVIPQAHLHLSRTSMMTTILGRMKWKPCAEAVPLTPWTDQTTLMAMEHVMHWMM